MTNSKCKICRRLGVKLFLKGERCLSQKCSMVRKPYPPGEKRKRRTRSLSGYGRELREKQKLRNWYNLSERQFRNYVKKVFNSLKSCQIKEDTSNLLIRLLESRLDNVVFRLGLAPFRRQARQLISHGHFLVNGKKVNKPSYQVKKGDIITVSPSSRKKTIFQNLSLILKKRPLPTWLSLDVEKLEGKVIGVPSLEEAEPPADIPLIFEFYSK